MAAKQKTCKFCTRTAAGKARFSYILNRPVRRVYSEKKLTWLCHHHREIFREIRDTYGFVTMALMRKRIIEHEFKQQN